MTDDDPDQVDGGWVSQQDGKREKNPGQVGSSEREETEEAHPHVLVTAPPDVNHHESEGRP
eukprot:CAMPEP_0185750144 /NCGR_PEP_ID=MMETSP1174-20130828/8888_1 /TAXON_ID=35687 /ORGANISM="Dictyocha speculum, Strain CCMP1381" /LENGTH=60 /DNA_ID=CAMNT_0028426559 /DNA_START=550 /DNA_END=732 /DNA_ORIENTATION=+